MGINCSFCDLRRAVDYALAQAQDVSAVRSLRKVPQKDLDFLGPALLTVCLHAIDLRSASEASQVAG